MNPYIAKVLPSVLSQKPVSLCSRSFAGLNRRVRPTEGRGIGVVALHEQLDLLLEPAHAIERNTADALIGDQREQVFDLMELRTSGGRKA